MWASTVLGATTMRAAIAPFERPSAISVRTWAAVCRAPGLDARQPHGRGSSGWNP